MGVAGDFSAAPAADQTFFLQQADSASNTETANNSTPQTTPLARIIGAIGLGDNTIVGAGTAYTGGPVDELNQTTDVRQTGSLTNTIVLNNSGEIDALFGISGIIGTLGSVFINSAAILENYNNASVTGTLDQALALLQTNTIYNSIRETNSADIDATFVGMAAQIDNLGFLILSNNSIVLNRNASAQVAGGNTFQVHDLYAANSVSSDIQIVNSGDIDALTGIDGLINNQDWVTVSNVSFINNFNGNASLASTGDFSQRVQLDQYNLVASGVSIVNRGDVDATRAIQAQIFTGNFGTLNNFASIGQANGTAAAVVVSDLFQLTQLAQANIIYGSVNVQNQGDLAGRSGILASATTQNVAVIANENDLGNVNGQAGLVSLGESTQIVDSGQLNALVGNITVNNSGGIAASGVGIEALVRNQSIVSVRNITDALSVNGDANVASFGEHFQGVRFTQANDVNSGVSVTNSGPIVSRTGIVARIDNISINQLSNVFDAEFLDGQAALYAIETLTQDLDLQQANSVNNNLSVLNRGAIDARGDGVSAAVNNAGIALQNVAISSMGNGATSGTASDVTQNVNITQRNTVSNRIAILNQGSIEAGGAGISAQILNTGLTFNNQENHGFTNDPADDATQSVSVTQASLIESEIEIKSGGEVRGGTVGIFASIPDAQFSGPASQTSRILIENTGSITARSLFAIDTEGATTTIVNRGGGVITGFVDLTDKADRFFNQSGGTFEARRTSDFGGGGDLFRNSAGGTVHTAENRDRTEITTFVNLERFENRGLISLQDFRQGDVFEISNTPGQNDLAFRASGGSTLAIDAFLGPPGSIADNFIINGDVTGRTELKVLNTNPYGGALNRTGIPVAFVNGDVSSNAFYLEKPIDAGFFDFDLFFVPTGSGFFELRSHPGGGAHILPHVVTATHDVFQLTAETWFDQSADLRLLLASGACATRNRVDMQGRCEQNVTPSAWARASAGWFNLEDKATTTSSGRTYHYDLGRDLDIMNFESGFDFGKQDLLAPGDLLIFGVLGGFVQAELDYETLARKLDVSGGEAGAYATYLRGGFFFDTLFKAVFLEHDFQEGIGFPDDFGGNVYGLRSDTGYRFGGFKRGPFIEPLATIAVSWTDIEDFTIGGNDVDFKDDANVRGRLGLRLGTSTKATQDVMMEPFVVGSLWGTLSGSHSASLTSAGEIFTFTDEPEDLWGVVSAGVNFFNFTSNTTVFAKVDVTFGDDLDGVGGKAGMRVAW